MTTAVRPLSGRRSAIGLPGRGAYRLQRTRGSAIDVAVEGAHKTAEYCAWSGLEEPRVAGGANRFYLVHPAHARDDLLDAELLRLGSRSDAGASDIREHRCLWILEIESRYHIGELLARRVD